MKPYNFPEENIYVLKNIYPNMKVLMSLFLSALVDNLKNLFTKKLLSLNLKLNALVNLVQVISLKCIFTFVKCMNSI